MPITNKKTANLMFFAKKMRKYLVDSKNSSTFAPANEK